MPYIKKRFQGVNLEDCSELESKFALTWQDCAGEGSRDLLRNIMKGRKESLLPVLSERDQLVAATLFQWLGTVQGQIMLQQALGGNRLKAKSKAKFGRR